jgi:elongator complex protein 3
MPGIPGMSEEEEIQNFKELFENQNFQPDMLKIYPCMVMKGTKLYDAFKKGDFTPISTEQSITLLRKVKPFIPRYVRIMRTQRDIPTKMTVYGVDLTNLRQLLHNEMKKHGEKCNCIRCREIKNEKIKDPVEFEVIEYKASNGYEYFISLKDKNDKIIGFTRLRIPYKQLREEITKDTAIIRELHVYGNQEMIGKSEYNAQHKGFGKKLLQKAEEIAIKNNKNKMIIISGVGVRQYYRKFGYELEGPYMSKVLKK